MAQEDSTKRGSPSSTLKQISPTKISPTIPRKLTRTKAALPLRDAIRDSNDPLSLARDDSNDDISLPHSEHHKYQTIQSFRPEEVKSLLAQHFLDPAVSGGRTSVPSEDGVRRFSLVKNNFKARRAIRNSKDAAMLRGMMDDAAEAGVGGVGGIGGAGGLSAGVKSSSAPDGSGQFLQHYDSKGSVQSDTSDYELDTTTEVTRLRAQLVQERSIYTREMARMRSQLRAFESHLAQTVARMSALLEMVDAREHTVQDLLVKSADFANGDDEPDRKEKDTLSKGNEREKKVDFPAIRTFDLLT